MTNLGKKIRSIRTGLGLDQIEFAKRIENTQPNVSRWESKGQMPSAEAIVKIAALAGIDTADLIGIKKNAPAKDTAHSLTVIGAVQAGAWAEAQEWPLDERYEVSIPVPEKYQTYPRYAVEVRGPSMNLRYPEGSVLVCVKLLDMDHKITPGNRYIIQRKDPADEYEMTVKELRVDDDGQPWLWPDSDHPAHQAPLPVTGNDGDEIEIIAVVVSSYQPD